MGLLLNIYIGKKKLRPLARNLLRAVALQADCGLAVLPAEEEIICVSEGALYPNDAMHFLLEAFSSLDSDIPLTKLLKRQLSALLFWLKEQTGGREESFGFSPEDIWEEVRRQSVFYTAGEPEPKFRDFWRKWREQYPYPQEFQVTGKSTVNEINREEAGDYLKAHQNSGSAAYIENAAKSLLATIPIDVESILDIGAGPGYMDRFFPSDYAVLAMDIDEQILNGNPRPTCVGDIMDLPLLDRSVDFVMASDVIEHLPKDVLQAGMREMERVSRKYIYLQVPFLEDPFMAFAHCPQCGNVWHVNHHKRFFDRERLCSLLSKDWRPTVVNFTGDVSFRRNGFLEAKLAETVGWQICMVKNAICPKCGGKSACIGNEYREKLERLVAGDMECPFPAYSEIGILFCRSEKTAELPEVASASYLGVRPRNMLLLGNGAKLENNYDPQRLLPAIHAMGCKMENSLEASWFCRTEAASSVWCGIFFPALSTYNAKVKIDGMLSSEGTVRLVLGNEGEEQMLAEWNWDQRKGSYVCRLPENVQGKPLLLKLYFSEPALGLFRCELLGNQSTCCEWNAEKNTDYLCFKDEHIQYRLLMANSGRMIMSHLPKDWLRLTNGISARIQRAFQLLIADIDRKKRDNRRLMEDTAWQYLLGDDNKQTKDNRCFLEGAAWQQVFENNGQSRDDNRGLIEDSMLMESVAGIYREAKKRGCLGIEGLNHLTQICGKWVRNHDKIYDFLMYCGAKNYYLRFKRRLEK